MGVCKEWGYNGGKERVELWVIKEEQGKKKKNSSSTILALRAAPDPGKARKSSRRGNLDNAYTPALGGPDKGLPTTRGAQFSFPFRKSGDPRKAFLRKCLVKAMNQKPRQFHGEKPISKN